MESTDILAFVVSTKVLDQYRSQDKCLDELISMVSKAPEVWQTCMDIAVMSPPGVPAPQVERIARRRLEDIPDEPGTEQIKVTTTQLIEYCVAHPDAGICGVTFNCPERSYTVRCGQVNEHLDVICVEVGKHIPEYALRRKQSG